MKKLCKCKTQKLLNILKDFDQVTQSSLGPLVTICSVVNGTYTRKITDRDKLDVILDAWTQTSEALLELGIDLEADES